MQLKSNRTYSFVLMSESLSTRDGYPLATFKLEFKTK
jgi:hypothetical protein